MKKLNILWTTDNKETALHMIALYAINAKKHQWFEEINVIIWGASGRLIAEDHQVKTEVLEMLNAGITVEACHACSDALGVTGILKKLGVDVKYMGQPLTDYLKSDDKMMTI